jgi:hypothetical protein
LNFLKIIGLRINKEAMDHLSNGLKNSLTLKELSLNQCEFYSKGKLE